jgi:hypothetical protein
MHTFTLQKGYLSNNISSETWSWHKDLYDLRSNKATQIVDILRFLNDKIDLVFGCAFGFALISCLNGLVVRMALTCSNIIIIPILWITKKCTGLSENDRN